MQLVLLKLKGGKKRMQSLALTVEQDNSMSRLNAFVVPSLFIIEDLLVKFFNWINPISSLSSFNVRGLFRAFVHIQKHSLWLSIFIIASCVCR